MTMDSMWVNWIVKDDEVVKIAVMVSELAAYGLHDQNPEVWSVYLQAVDEAVNAYEDLPNE